MSKKSRKNNDKLFPVKPQNYSWKQVKIYETYKEAESRKCGLKKEGHENIKIRRCDSQGLKFKVLIGTAVKRNNEKKKNEKT